MKNYGVKYRGCIVFPLLILIQLQIISSVPCVSEFLPILCSSLVALLLIIVMTVSSFANFINLFIHFFYFNNMYQFYILIFSGIRNSILRNENSNKQSTCRSCKHPVSMDSLISNSGLAHEIIQFFGNDDHKRQRIV